MRVLVLSQYFWPETFRITEVVQSLRDTGCAVTVLTGQPNYPDGVVPPGYSAAALRTQIRDGLTIHRVPLVPRGSGSALRLALNYLSFVVSAAVFGPWLLRGQRVDAILVYAPSPILQVIPAVWLRWIKGAKLVTWVQDLWPESLSATGFVRNQKVLGAVSAIVRWIYRKNDLLLVQSQAFVEPVVRMAGCTPVAYHPNPGELAFSKPDTDSACPLQLEPGFNVVFAGNLGTVQALDTVLAAAQLLREESDVRFVLVGSGSRSEWLQQETRRLGLDNVGMPGRYPPSDMPGILAQASAVLVSLVRDPIMSQTVPSKVQAYLAAGRPIIASLDGEGARVVVESGAGVACPAEDAQALAEAVIQLRDALPEERQRMGKCGSLYYEQHFEPKLLARRLAQTLSEIVSERLAAGTETKNG
ncbi:MAG: glycosyltransferase family 4 protein [Polaromonas sp.]|uniref:glycosyltransferase family 4 protein n=1 Tax=Polaromonas sp. TaxID=1869339 RepID=UPI002733ED6C|nr:glycosyltransferase family 4 protein [Polaromonas sp.]MDP2820535.1 glycosyltransferase family 4 protein [Polaromonas sp.]